MRRRQLELLTARHSMEDVILARVLVEYYQHVAVEAKTGELDRASRDFAVLREQIPSPPHEELRWVVDVGALPVRALIRWKRDDLAAAREDLVAALDACSLLAVRYAHDYLTGRQFHLAVNLARLAVAEGEHGAARRLLSRLQATARGDRRAWPFSGAHKLRVPLTGPGAAVIDAQISKVMARTEAGRV
jgi:hypothetical protein